MCQTLSLLSVAAALAAAGPIMLPASVSQAYAAALSLGNSPWFMAASRVLF